MRGPQAFFTFCPTKAAQTHALLGIYPQCLVCPAVRLDGILSSFVHVQMYGLGMLSAMRIFWICWLFMNIFPPCQHQSHCVHTHSVSRASLMLPMANIETSQCVRVWSLFPSPCQEIPQDLVLNPDAIFLKFLGVHQLLIFTSLRAVNNSCTLIPRTSCHVNTVTEVFIFPIVFWCILHHNRIIKYKHFDYVHFIWS